MHTAPKADHTVLPTEGEALTVGMMVAKKSGEMGRGRFNN